MKKIILIVAAILLLGSCGVPLREDGSFGNEQFVGKFRDVSIYAVVTPGGDSLYIGVHDDGATSVTHKYTQLNGKATTIKYRTVIIDGKEFIEKEGK